MSLPKNLAWLVAISGLFCTTLSSPLKDASQPHVIRKRDSIEDFYWNENLPLGFFIKNGGGDGAGNNGQSATAALFGAGSGQAATSAFGRSSIPKKPQAAESALKTIITCEGEKEWLECEKYNLINVKSAFWGRDDSNTCTNNAVSRGLKTDAMCPQDESNTMTKVRNQCQDENACELSASTIFFDKTDCPRTYKYLKLEYECRHSESKIKE